MAIGMLIASPLAGIWADRHGSRTLAALGMVVSAAGLIAMTTLGVDSPYWQSSLWLLLVGIGSGMFNSPNTAAMMGVVPANRRGVAAGARMMLQNTGAVLSIAFVMAIVTAAVPKSVLLAIFSGVTTGLSQARLDPFIHNMHTALWVLAATSVVGAFVSLLRPTTAKLREAEPRPCRHDHRDAAAHRRGGGAAGHDHPHDPLLRGDRAARLPAAEREAGRHRTYEEADVERLSDALRFKQLLGLSLEELKALLEAEEARAALRTEWREHDPDEGRRREILEQALGHIDRQLELVRRRRQDIDALEGELADKRAKVRRKLRELKATAH